MQEPMVPPIQEYNESEERRMELVKEKEALQQEIEQSLQEIIALRWDMLHLKRARWNPSSKESRLPDNPAQLNICFNSPSYEDDPIGIEKEANEKAYQSEKGYDRFRKNFTKKITPQPRKPLPQTLPREEILLPMPEEISLEGAVKVGEEISEQYAIRPTGLYVIRIICP